ncbi:winged helix-turn-helix transcriptional regulator [Azotobacter chroococcum]|uniref:winged helix-turn-helix transcriptional regulator n=1 Tax=Azotobacter chroococcum TaxID=353 RepID=UPI0010AE66E6|nr:winged helix-turn-helix transcriptional regulator [Azotobacter chroococcum]
MESTADGSVQSSEETSLLALLRSNPALTARQAAERLGLSQRAVEKQLAALKAGSCSRALVAALA